MMRRAAFVAVAAGLALGTWGTRDSWGSPPGTSETVGYQLVTQNLDNPVGIAHAGDGSGRLFIVQRGGAIRIVDGGQVLAAPFLNISARLTAGGGEQGLLGLAFHPEYATGASNGWFYVSYTQAVTGDLVVSRFQVTNDPDVADPNSESVVIVVPQPSGRHNGGQIVFGPDGYLYIGTGDGGANANDAQDMGKLLGKLLRIDVDAGAQPYLIPADNPYVGVAGVRGEIWASGLRNPWRFSFDRQTDDLFIADVGESSWEEVNVRPASSAGGENYGWPTMEGRACYSPSVGCSAAGITLPDFEYPHLHRGGFVGCSITGGFRYRGNQYPALQGVYVFVDWCNSTIWGATPNGAGEWTASVMGVGANSTNSFGESEDGELYFVAGNALYQIVTRTGPYCDIQINRGFYEEGDVVTLTTLRIGNSSANTVSADVILTLEPPSGGVLRGVTPVTVPAGVHAAAGPVNLFRIFDFTLRGWFRIGCELVETSPGQGPLDVDRNTFEVE